MQRLLSICVILGLAGCEKAPEPETAITSVTVAPAIEKTITDWDEYTGRIESLHEVEVKSEVSGALDEVRLQDGAMVKEGDILFVISPRRYRALVQQAEGQLADAKSRLALAVAERDRAQNLLKTNAISKQDFDARAAQVELQQAAIAQAEATVEQAKIDLEHTEVRAPISGKASRAEKQKGSLVQADTRLTTIVQTDTVRVNIDIDERSLLRYQRIEDVQDKEQGVPEEANEDLDIFMGLADEAGTFPHKGTIDFSDNKLDPMTGTLRAGGLFENPKKLFTPGLFARVRIPGSLPHKAILVPSEAIAANQDRRYVLVVDAKNVAEMRIIEVGAEVDGMRVIRKGLAAGEKVITEGLLTAIPGEQVNPIEKAGESPAAAAQAETK